MGRTWTTTAARAEEFGARPYTSVAEVVDAERPALLSVCLPNEGHFETTLECIRTDIPLLVEEPPVIDLAQADVLLP